MSRCRQRPMVYLILALFFSLTVACHAVPDGDDEAPAATHPPAATAAPTRPAVPPPPIPTGGDKWALWTGPTQLRGANIYQRRVDRELDGNEFMRPGPVGPPYTQEDFNRLAALGANSVNISHPGLFTENPPYTLDQGVQDNLGRAWLDDPLSKADDFASTHGVPVSVNEFSVVRWAEGAAQFMDDQMALFGQRGMNHAMWTWDPAWEPPGTEERAALLVRIYDRLLDAATLERLTQRRPKCTIAPGDSGAEGRA